MIIVKEGDKFRVLVMFDGEMYSLGLYDTEEHAINSYNAMKKKHYIGTDPNTKKNIILYWEMS